MQRLQLTLWAFIFGVVIVSTNSLHSVANEVGFIEEYALASDRQAALAQLIPGSDDYYFFNCLHLQTTGKLDNVEPMLREWIKRHGTNERTQQIIRRQAMLNYPNDAKQSLEYLRKELGLNFNHQRQVLDTRPKFPTRLDPKNISRDAFLRRALRPSRNLGGFTDVGLRYLDTSKLDAVQRRSLLERLQYPEVNGLPELIVKDLAHKGSRGFGSLNIHRQLTISQLDELVRLKPELLNEQAFIDTYLMKLQPSTDTDWQSDDAETLAYLERLETFVSRLQPVHNSLRTHVLYHRLAFDRARHKFDRDRFMEYIKLPRNSSYINPKFLRESSRFMADLNHNCQSATLLPPIHDDEPLVHDYLAHFFVKDSNYKAYERFVTEQYLKPLFAETKLINGIGDAPRWYSMLSPAGLQQLRDRVDIEFAATNQVRHRENDQVAIDVDIKNVSTLIVKVYEINTQNYYRENRREVNTDINLDGLVANFEETYNYNESPLRRVSRNFKFPQLEQPGVYVVDFIGNGMSSRAVIRKGQRRFLVRTTAAGQAFTVLDESNKQVSGASIWMDGQTYEADPKGRIVVPFSTSPGTQQIVISHNGWSSLHQFQHDGENYELAAGIYVDRESLLQHQDAMVVIRGGLNLNGQPIGFAPLENIRLKITATDLDGVQTTQEVGNLKLHLDRETTHRFHVPPRLGELKFDLIANVKQLSTGQQITLNYSRSYSLNEMDLLAGTQDLHFAEVNGQYVMDLLGKTGEPLADRPVNVSVLHREFIQPIRVQLQTDSDGRIELGPLTDIRQLSAPSVLGRACFPIEDQHTQYRSFHAVEGEVVRLPHAGRRGNDDDGALRLYELRRHGRTRADRVGETYGRIHHDRWVGGRRLFAATGRRTGYAVPRNSRPVGEQFRVGKESVAGNSRQPTATNR